MKRHRARSSRATAVIGLLAVLVLPGCFNPFSPRVLGRGVSTPPPTPNSPSGVLRLFAWCYNNREPNLYGELFTDDFRFVFGAADPDGIPYRDNPWTRDDEIISTTKLFFGGGPDQPAASRIDLNLDQTFLVLTDSRPGKAAKWHKRIHTGVELHIDINGSRTDVAGLANFYLVRGDSAKIPQELLDRGFLPDSNRWYIQLWEDETTPSGGVGGSTATPAPTVLARPERAAALARLTRTAPAATPAWEVAARTLSWGALKVLYRAP